MIDTSNFNFSTQILNTITTIDKFNGYWNGSFNTTNKRVLLNLKKISTIESIGSSNRIEGNKLSDTEIATVLKNLNKNSFRDRNDEEVAGYANLLNTIFDNYINIPVTENHIKYLHKVMLNVVSKDNAHCGEYKKIPNSVVAFDKHGIEIGTIFETATPFDTQRLMTELITWINQALEEKILHPLIVIAIFVVHFLAIHPFQDGNGRLSRALTILLLLRSGSSYVPYSSIESIIELNKTAYYSALRQSQKNIWNGKVNYEPWIEFFLSILQQQVRNLEAKMKRLKQETSLSKNAKVIAEFFMKQPEWTARELSEKSNVNLETVRKILQSLCKQNYIVKFGTTKSSFYRKMD